MSVPYLAQAGDHQKIEWLGGGVLEVLLGAEHTGGQLAAWRSSLPRGAASPVHVHAHEDEVFIVLRGSAVFWVGDQRLELEEGGIAFLPRDLPHAYHFTGSANDLITICTPAGIEEFFRAAGWDLSQPKPEGWVLTPAAIAAAGARTGQTTLGPPLAPTDAMPASLIARG